MRSVLLVLVFGAATLRPLAAQSLARRIAEAPDGRVTFRFAARPGVCGDGDRTIGDGRSLHMTSISGSRDLGSWRSRCEPGPVRVVLALRDGRPTSLRTFVGESRARTASGTDLGTVAAREAVDYLLELAETGPASVSEDAIFPAALADSVTIWPALLRVARAPGRPRDAREQASFWLSHLASRKLFGEAADEEEEVEDDDVEDREKAVFALSQLDHNAGVPALIEVARTHRMPQVRRKALFWLGQSGDPRALAVFEEILK